MSNDHPDLKTAAAAIELLKTIPTIWTPIPELPHANEAALGLLTGAGLVERRVRMRLRAAGKPEAVDLTLQFYGQAGLAQASEPGIAEAWRMWGMAHETERPHVYVEWPDGAGEWRLTDQGTTAQDEANRGETTYLRDFLRTPGLAGMDGMGGPLRFVPGVWRPMVHGEGHVLSVKLVGAAAPLNVHVDNLVEVSGPLESIAEVIRDSVLPAAPETRSNRRPSSAAKSAQPDDEAFFSPHDLAVLFNVPYEPLRKRLERYRHTNHNGWNPVSDPRPREPRYLYQVAAVKHLIDELRASSELSRQRPAKKQPPS